MMTGLHIRTIRGEATICLADGQPLYGTDTYGDLDAIAAWLATMLGGRGEEILLSYLETRSGRPTPEGEGRPNEPR